MAAWWDDDALWEPAKAQPQWWDDDALWSGDRPQPAGQDRPQRQEKPQFLADASARRIIGRRPLSPPSEDEWHWGTGGETGDVPVRVPGPRPQTESARYGLSGKVKDAGSWLVGGRTPTEFASDLATGFNESTVRLGDALLAGTDAVTGGMIDRGVVRPLQSAVNWAMTGKFEDSGGLQGGREAAAEYFDSFKSDALKSSQRELSQTQGFFSSARRVLTDPVLMAQFFAEQIPIMGSLGVVARNAATQAFEAATRSGLSRAAAERAAQEASQRAIMGTTAGMGASFSAQDAVDQALSLPDDVWDKAPGFADLAERVGREQAKQQLARYAALEAMPIAATASLIGSRITAPLESRVFTGRMRTGLGPMQTMLGLGGAMGSESLQEVIEESGEALGVNQGIRRHVDPSRSLMDGVPEAAGVASVVGGTMGGAMYTGGRMLARDEAGDAPPQRQRPDEWQQPQPKPVIGDGEDLLSGGTVPGAMAQALQQQVAPSDTGPAPPADTGGAPGALARAVDNLLLQNVTPEAAVPGETGPDQVGADGTGAPADGPVIPRLVDDNGNLIRSEYEQLAQDIGWDAALYLATAQSEGRAATMDEALAHQEQELARRQQSEPAPVDIAAAQAATAPDNPVQPTQAQKEAGNYRMGHIRLDGLDISIENPAGSERSGTDADGNPWSTTMQAHYGYIKGTRGADGDHIDAFIRPGYEGGADTPVFVVHQLDPATGEFDEHIVMIGYASQAEAEAAYLSNYDDGWQGMGGVEAMTAAEFKEWIRDPTGPIELDHSDIRVPESGVPWADLGLNPPPPRNRVRGIQDFDPVHHDLLDWIALNGGLDREVWQAEGIDPAEWRDRAGQRRNQRFFGRPLFRKGSGMTPHDLRELMEQTDWLPPVDPFGQSTNWDDDAVQLVMRAVNQGERIKLWQGQEADQRVEQWEQGQIELEQDARMASELHYPSVEAMYDDIEFYLAIEQRRESDHEDRRPESGGPGAVPPREGGTSPTTGNAVQDTGPKVYDDTPAGAGEVPGFQLDGGRAGPGQAQQGQVTPQRPASQPGLFAPPTAQEVIAAERQRRQDATDGRTGRGDTSMLAGEGELFAGPRPQQLDVEHETGRPGDRAEPGTVPEQADPGDMPSRLARMPPGEREVFGLNDAMARRAEPGHWRIVAPEDAQSGTRDLSPEAAMHVLRGYDAAVAKLNGQLIGNSRGASTQALIDAWVNQGQVRASIERSRSSNPELWAAYDSRQAAVMALSRGDQARLPEVLGGGTVTIIRKFKKNWRVADNADGDGAMLIAPEALAPVTDNQQTEPLGDNGEPEQLRLMEKDQATYGKTSPLPDREGRDTAREPSAADGRRPRAVPGQLDLFVNAGRQGRPAAQPDIPRLRQSARLVTTGEFRTGIEQVNNWQDAAHVVAPLRKSPQEQVVALVLDDQNRPLAVIRHSIGEVAAASVERWSLAGAIAAVPGARSVYFAHNHPSGTTRQSGADHRITQVLSGLLEGSGIEPMGMIVVAPNSLEASFYNNTGGDAYAPIQPAVRTRPVPVQERQLRAVRPPERGPINPSVVRQLLPEASTNEAGIVLLDNQLQPVGRVPMPLEEMGRLRSGRTDRGTARILREVARGNAPAAVIYGPDLDIARNLAEMLSQALVRVVEVAITDGREWSLNASRVAGMTGTGRPFFSRQRGTRTPPKPGDQAVLGTSELLAAWTMVAGQEQAYQLPVSDSANIYTIFREVAPGFRVVSNEDAQIHAESEGADRGWMIYTPAGREGVIFQRGGEVWINVSQSQRGEEGSRIYNAVANFAYNNNLVFTGDPAGLSDVAMYRRLENMLSSALKFGTTEHLYPHERQLAGSADLGVPALDWRIGDDGHNLHQLLNASYQAVLAQAPEIRGMAYNPDTSRFERADGSEVTDEQFNKLAERTRAGQDQRALERGARRAAGAGVRGVQQDASRPGQVGAVVGPSGVGRRTLKRAVLTHSLVSGTRESRSRLLARLGRERGARGLLSPALQKILYSWPAFHRPSFRRPASRTRPRIKAADLNARVQQVLNRWRGDVPDVTVVQSARDLPNDIRRLEGHETAEGVYMMDGRVYLVADNLPSMRRAMQVLVHEVIGHHGIEAVVGPEQWAQIVADIEMMRASGKFKALFEDVDSRYDRTDPAYYREVVAIMAERGVGTSVVDRVIAAVRRFLADLGLTGTMTEDRIRQVIIDAARHVRRGEVGMFAPAAADGTRGRSAFSFAGPRAATADTMALETAQQRIEAGENAEQVRQDTGWFRGADGKWRFEIDDSGARVVSDIAEAMSWGNRKDFKAGSTGGLTLGELLDHPRLFAAYPELTDVWVTLRHGNDVSGSYRPSTDVITIHAVYDRDSDTIRLTDGQLSTLLHEVQHAIQYVEGFATGGNPQDAFADPRMRPGASAEGLAAAHRLLNERLAQLAEPISIEQFMREGWRGQTEITPEIRELYDEYVADVARAARSPEMARHAQSWASREWYLRLAGEVEARNVQTRQMMTADDRRATPPSATQEFADSDVIVVFNGQEAHSAPPPANAGTVTAQDSDGAMFSRADEAVEYRGQHTAPTSDDGAPAHDVTGGGEFYPDDVYGPNGPRYYSTGHASDSEAFAIINRLRGRPDADVTIYRAVPKGRGEINRGDWVAITRDYARGHGESVLKGDYQIITKTVKARDIFTNADSIQEWGYDPQDAGLKESADALPTRSEIMDVLRAHPFTRLRGNVGRVFVAGSFATGAQTARSDIDVVIEVPRGAADLQAAYRKRVGDYFMKNDLRGVHDEVHPQWNGRRIDVYFVEDAEQEADGRPIIELDDSGGITPQNPQGESNRPAHDPVDEAGATTEAEIEQARRAWQEQGTDSPWFKRWFRDSKVVDADGNPLVVYHGTDEQFDVFEMNRPAWRAIMFDKLEVESQGSFFSEDESDARQFGRNLMPVYLSVQNPFIDPADVPVSSSDPESMQRSKRAWEDAEYILEPLIYEYAEGVRRIDYNNGISATEVDPDGKWISKLFVDGKIDWDVLDNPEVVARLKERGYDGARVNEPTLDSGMSWFVVSPEQIKSATDNRGTFDPAERNIYFSSGNKKTLTKNARGSERALARKHAKVEAAINQVLDTWGPNKPVVEVVRSAEDLPDWIRNREPTRYKRARGVRVGNRVWIVTNGLVEATAVEESLGLLAHEAVGHYGLDNIIDQYLNVPRGRTTGEAGWERLTADIVAWRDNPRLDARVREIMYRVQRRYARNGRPPSDQEFAREVVAHMAQAGLRNSIMDRVVAAVRRFLRQRFPGLKVNDAEVRQMIAEAAAWLQQPTEQASGQPAAAMEFANAGDPFYSALARATEEARGAPRRGNATAWKQWLDGAQRRGEFRQAERDWLGVDDWLDAQEGPVTREALADFIRANEVRVEEVALSDADKQAASRARDLYRQRQAQEEKVNSLRSRATDDMYSRSIRDEAAALLPDAEKELMRLDVAYEAANRAAKQAIEQDTPTKFSDYQLPGGQNYRELLLTLPDQSRAPDGLQFDQAVQRRLVEKYGRLDPADWTEAEAQAYREENRALDEAFDTYATQIDQENRARTYRSPHFDEPNILVHVRFNERTDADGKRVLFIEEIQSDWHQKGRKKGYMSGALTEAESLRRQKDIFDRFDAGTITREQRNEELSRLSDDRQGLRGVPDAPFKATDEWAMLAFKRMARWAVDNGFDRIAWTPGDVQADRYDLSRQIDAIIYEPNEDGTYIVSAVKNGLEMWNDMNATTEVIEETLGKEIAEKIVAGEGNPDKEVPSMKSITGIDLRMGGEGMRAFYDQILPKAVNKWAKKFGAKTRPVKIDDWTAHGIDITPKMRDSVLDGQPLFNLAESQADVAGATTEAEVEQARRAWKELGTDSPWFKRWFGDSKVVDADGRPLVVYHGTADDFDVFDPAQRGRQTGAADAREGFFFAENPDAADQFTWDRGEKSGSIMPVYLSLKNPLISDHVLDGASNTEAARIIADARDKGHDGVIFERSNMLGHEGRTYVAFRREQIKSATGNRGTFDPESPSILLSRPRQYTSGQKEFMRKAGLPVESRTRLERLNDWVTDQVEALRQFVADGDTRRQALVDRFHGIRAAYEATGQTDIQRMDGYVSARLSTGLAAVMESVMMHGAPQWQDGVLGLKPGTKGLMAALEPVKGDLDAWLGWMVARRAKLLMGQGREHNMTEADIDAGLDLAKGKEAQFMQAAYDYLQIKNAILDVAEEAGLIDPDARATWDHAEYIPFYRAGEESVGPGTRRSLANQSSGIRTLRGGKSVLADPLANIMRNFTRLIDASMKNNAMLEVHRDLGADFFQKVPSVQFTGAIVPRAQIRKQLLESGVPQSVVGAIPDNALEGMAKMWAVKPPTADDVVRIMRNGKAEYYRVDDPLLLRSMSAFAVKPRGAGMKVMIWAKRILTAGATATAEFAAANTIRDSLEGWMVADENFKPLVDSIRGALNTLRADERTQELMMAGSYFAHGHIWGGDVDATAAALRRSLRAHGIANKDMESYIGTIARSPAKLWDTWTKVQSSLEHGTRRAMYDAALREGKTRKQAAFTAKDLLDFSMRGDSEFIAFFTDVVPFLNARLQGLYKVGRTYERNRNQLAMRGGMIATATLALLAWNLLAHGDAYDELPEWEKDTYWHIGPGTVYHTRIPKPFELGIIFGTAIERGARAILNLAGSESGESFGKTFESMTRALAETLALDPTPQAVKPIVEQLANRDFFRDVPIEGLADEHKLPEARYGPRTSDTARLVPSAVANVTGMSPKRIEHLWRGYTAGLGDYAMRMSDFLVRRAQGEPYRPAMEVRDWPLIGRFVRGDAPARSTRFQSEFYDAKRKAEQVAGTIKEYLERAKSENRPELLDRAMKLHEDNLHLLGPARYRSGAKGSVTFGMVTFMNRVQRQVSAIREQEQAIINDPTLSRTEKRDLINDLIQQRNDILREAMEVIGG